MTFMYGTILLCSGIVLEATLGLAGVSIPVVLITVFYLFTAHSSKALFWAGCFSAVFIDVHFLRPALPTLLLTPGVFVLAKLWRENGKVSNPFFLAIPGWIIGISHGAVLFLINGLAVHPLSCIHPLVFLADAMLPAFVLPALVVLFDSFARRAGLPRLCDAQPTRKEFYAYRKKP